MFLFTIKSVRQMDFDRNWIPLRVNKKLRLVVFRPILIIFVQIVMATSIISNLTTL